MRWTNPTCTCLLGVGGWFQTGGPITGPSTCPRHGEAHIFALEAVARNVSLLRNTHAKGFTRALKTLQEDARHALGEEP